jgi:hypothetical protein
MTKISLDEARVSKALAVLKERHQVNTLEEISKIFEEVYHCRIIPDPTDPWCTSGWLEMSEEKYYTWFAIQFGDTSE